MLIDQSIFDALRWIAIGAFVCGLAAIFIFIPKNIDRRSEHAAKIRKRVLVALGVLAVLVAAAFTIEPLGTDVVVVRDVNDVRKSRAVLFGSHAYTFHDGHVEVLHKTSGAIVVNDTSTAMQVVLASYGDVPSAIFASMIEKPETVAPMALTVSAHRIDFIGPNDKPPESVKGVHSEQRHWLRW